MSWVEARVLAWIGEGRVEGGNGLGQKMFIKISFRRNDTMQ